MYSRRYWVLQLHWWQCSIVSVVYSITVSYFIDIFMHRSLYTVRCTDHTYTLSCQRDNVLSSTLNPFWLIFHMRTSDWQDCNVCMQLKVKIIVRMIYSAVYSPLLFTYRLHLRFLNRSFIPHPLSTTWNLSLPCNLLKIPDTCMTECSCWTVHCIASDESSVAASL